MHDSEMVFEESPLLVYQIENPQKYEHVQSHKLQLCKPAELQDFAQSNLSQNGLFWDCNFWIALQQNNDFKTTKAIIWNCSSRMKTVCLSIISANKLLN